MLVNKDNKKPITKVGYSASERALIEKHQDIIEDDYFRPIPKKMLGGVAQLIENQETWVKQNVPALKEDANIQSDIQYFKDMIVPIFRESVSNTSLMEVVGFQPINQKNSLFFVERFYYGNDSTTNGIGQLLSTQERGTNDPDFQSFVIRVTMSSGQYSAITVNSTYIKAAGGGGANLAKIMYKEECYGGAKLLVKLESGQDLPSVGTVYVTGPNVDLSMTHAWNNEMGRSVILSNYGVYDTATGEALENWKTVKISLESVNVTAVSHKLSFELTQETISDLAKTTGDDAKKRLTAAINWQLAMSINKKLFNLMSSSAENVTGWVYSTADGRYEMEKLMTLKSKIKYEQNRIGVKTQKGRANFAITTSATGSIVELIPGFVKDIPEDGGDQAGYVKLGYLDGITYYMSTVDAEYGNFVLLGYKGSMEHDAGVFYCPYIPLIVSFANKYENPELQKTAFSQRAAYEKNPYGSERYLTLVDVDLTGSQFA